MTDPTLSRRRIVQLGAAGTLLARSAAAAPVDSGAVQGGRVEFPSITAPTEGPSGGPPNPMPLADRVGFAVVGLGRLSLEEILPAFGVTKKSRLVALVSGTPDKAAGMAAQYGVRPDAVYDYAGFDRIRDNPEIRVVYVVLPNGMRKEYTIRAAQAGKDVLCEKPMAVSSIEGQAMVDACRAAGRKLTIAYRCQYEPYNREVLRMVRDKTKQPHTPGEEGVQDHRVMEAIYRSASTGQPVALPRVAGLDTTRGPAPA